MRATMSGNLPGSARLPTASFKRAMSAAVLLLSARSSLSRLSTRPATFKTSASAASAPRLGGTCRVMVARGPPMLAGKDWASVSMPR